jgi:hypothetical protein
MLLTEGAACKRTKGNHNGEIKNKHRACLDGGVSISLKQTNTKTNIFPNTGVSLVLVGTNTPKKLTPPRGGNWC